MSDYNTNMSNFLKSVAEKEINTKNKSSDKDYKNEEYPSESSNKRVSEVKTDGSKAEAEEDVSNDTSNISFIPQEDTLSNDKSNENNVNDEDHEDYDIEYDNEAANQENKETKIKDQKKEPKYVEQKNSDATISQAPDKCEEVSEETKKTIIEEQIDDEKPGDLHSEEDSVFASYNNQDYIDNEETNSDDEEDSLDYHKSDLPDDDLIKNETPNEQLELESEKETETNDNKSLDDLNEEDAKINSSKKEKKKFKKKFGLFKKKEKNQNQDETKEDVDPIEIDISDIKSPIEAFRGLTKEIQRQIRIMKNGYGEEVVHDGEPIEEKHRKFVVSKMDKLSETPKKLAYREIAADLRDSDTKVWSKDDINFRHSGGWNEIQRLLFHVINKDTLYNSKYLTYFAKKFAHKNKYRNIKLDPTDQEIIDGQPYRFYNLSKTLANHHIIKKLIIQPVFKGLDRFTYNNSLFDLFARKVQFPYYNKLNNMTRDERMNFLFIRKCIKIIITVIVIALSLNYYNNYSKPKRLYYEAQSAFSRSDYDKAFELYSKTNYKDSFYRAGLSLERMYVEQNKYEKALDILKKLNEKNASFNDVVLTDEEYEVLYKQAVHLYSKRDLTKAYKIFSSLEGYKKSNDYKNKVAYALAEDSFDKGENFKSMMYYRSILKYKDSKKRYNELGEGQYDEAMDLYKRKKYSDAKKIFSDLSNVKFKDSDVMKKQCEYRLGLDYLEAGQYKKCMDILTPIKDFKDSESIREEAIYRYSKNLMEHNTIKALYQMDKIEGYKDISTYLASPEFVLYGEWTINLLNDTRPKDAVIKFYEDGTINSNIELINVKTSTKAQTVPYSYDKKTKRFITGDYSLEIKNKDNDTNNITLIGYYKDKKTVYKLVRNKSLKEMLSDENKIKLNLEEESKNSYAASQIIKYLKKKIQ